MAIPHDSFEERRLSDPLGVLLIEGDPAGARLVRDELRAASPAPPELFFAPRLTEAIDLLADRALRGRVQVALLDLSLPGGLDGLGALVRAAPELPVVVLTSFADEQMGLAALELGAQDYLVKDQADGAVLYRALRYAVQRRRADENARRAAEEARVGRFRERFIGILGHDLRSPLQSILAGGRLLLDERLHRDDERRVLEAVVHSAERMDRILCHVVEFTRARLGAGYPVEPRPADFAAVARETVDELRLSHPGRRVELSVEGDPRGTFDPDALGQVVSNLVSNALAYGRPDAPVRVGVRRDGEELVLAVHNRGPAIPAEALPHLFDPFYRAGGERAADEGGGLGLGLYIAHEIVAAHQGALLVDSTDERGTTVVVRFPA
jgi:signal transduction histidine kinase